MEEFLGRYRLRMRANWSNYMVFKNKRLTSFAFLIRVRYIICEYSPYSSKQLSALYSTGSTHLDWISLNFGASPRPLAFTGSPGFHRHQQGHSVMAMPSTDLHPCCFAAYPFSPICSGWCWSCSCTTHFFSRAMLYYATKCSYYPQLLR